MTNTLHTRTLEILRNKKILGTDVYNTTCSRNNQEFQLGLKLYMVGLHSGDDAAAQELAALRGHICNAFSINGIDPLSKLGVAIRLPSIMPQYDNILSINMWESWGSGTETQFKHLYENNLFGISQDGLSQFGKKSDNLGIIATQIMGFEARLWEKVILGDMPVPEYLSQFADVF